jgi:hypothetical protein
MFPPTLPMIKASSLRRSLDHGGVGSGSDLESGPDPFAGGVAGGAIDGVGAVAAVSGEGFDDAQAPAAIGVEVLLRQVERVQGRLDHRCRLGRPRAAVPDGDQHSARVPAERKSDFLFRGLLGSIGDQLGDGQKSIVGNVKTVRARPADAVDASMDMSRPSVIVVTVVPSLARIPIPALRMALSN